MRESFLISAAFMVVGMVVFIFFPDLISDLFSGSAEVRAIGSKAFPIIGSSFIFAVFSLMMPIFFQAIGDGKTSLLLSLTRQVFCLIPIFWFFSLFGVDYTWIAFPTSEFISGAIGLILYRKELKKWKKLEEF